MTAQIPIHFSPIIGKCPAPAQMTLPAGVTVEAMVHAVLPDLTPDDRDFVLVSLVATGTITPVPQSCWTHVRPKPGVLVVVRTRPGFPAGALASVLSTIFTAAASHFGPLWAAALVPQAGALQTLVGGLITTGLTIVGGLLVQAFVPQPSASADAGERKATYAISGWRNEARPGKPVPLILGKHRYAPPFAAPSFTEIVGDTQYVRALFTFGYGRLDLSDLRIGDTPLSEFDEVEVEIREGLTTDEPVTLYPRQVLEDPETVELVRPFPRDDAGEVIEGDAAEETPVVRFTASDVTEASVILGFSSGLFEVDNSGNLRSRTVDIRIEQRAEGGTAWSEVTTLSITADKREPFYRQFPWTLPSRGRWELRITRMTDESLSTQVSDRCALAAIQSIRPEYPINMDKPLALVALRIKATHQLAGTLDQFNAIAQRYGPVWDGEAWTEGLTRSPASAYRTALQGDANPFPQTDIELDLNQIAGFQEFCADKNLKYDRVHENAESLAEMLATICRAGRATPRHDGQSWGVVIDTPSDVYVDEINPRNSSGIEWKRNYFDPPDGFRIRFPDQTNDYEAAERIVPWPGFEGVPQLTEALELPGKTDPDEIWVEARRRMYELIHRPDTFSTIQDGAVRAVTRGDTVIGCYDSLSTTQVAGRVRAVRNSLVELDEQVTMEAGQVYALRFRVFEDGDAVGTSVLRHVRTVPGTHLTVQLLQADHLPKPGTFFHFGLMESGQLPLLVKAIEPGQDMSSVLHMVAAAPIIDDLTDAEVPPAWNGRVGAEVEIAAAAPGVPFVTKIEHGLAGTDDADGLRVLFAPGSGTIPTATVRLEHKLASAGTYTETTVAVADGGATVAGYASGDLVDLRLVGISADDMESDPSPVVQVEIGADDPPVPGALDETSIMVSGGLGFAQISLATGTDTALARIQVYRVPSGDTLDRDLHAIGAPIQVTPDTTITYIDGDGTRADLVANGGFDSAADWTLDAGWTIASGEAAHSAGTADTIRQALSLTAGETYRGCVAISGRTAGDLTPSLFGGSDQTVTALDADGTHCFAIAAVEGNTDIGFTASSTFDGSIDDVVLFVESASCAPQGDFDYYLEPQNDNGGVGPTTSAVTITII